MGTYMNCTRTLIEDMEEALNDIEGDFSEEQLKEALEVMKKYPFVCDKNKSVNVYKKLKEFHKE